MSVFMNGQTGGKAPIYGSFITSETGLSVDLDLGGIPKFLFVTFPERGWSCSFVDPAVGKYLRLWNSSTQGSSSELRITIAATGFTHGSAGNDARNKVVNYLAIM